MKILMQENLFPNLEQIIFLYKIEEEWNKLYDELMQLHNIERL